MRASLYIFFFLYSVLINLRSASVISGRFLLSALSGICSPAVAVHIHQHQVEFEKKRLEKYFCMAFLYGSRNKTQLIDRLKCLRAKKLL